MTEIRPGTYQALYPYQDDGVDFLAGRPRAGLHDAMGLGKTAQVIRAADKINATRGLMVVPAKLRRNTVAQFHKWATRGYRITQGRNIHDFMAWSRGRYHIMVTSYELATKWAKDVYMSGEPLDFVAMDEAHYVKNADALRTKALLGNQFDGDGGLICWAEHVWHMSGTPMANDPLDIFTFLKMCRAIGDMKQWHFIQEFFWQTNTRYGTRTVVKENKLVDLTRLIDGNRVRRTLNDVGFQLPRIRLDSMIIDGDTKPIIDLLRQYPTLHHAIMAAVHAGKLSFIEAQHIMTLRRLLAEAKAAPYAHVLLDDIRTTGGEKFVVMGFHVDALAFIHKFLLANNVRAVLVNGTVSDRQADNAVRQFQDDPYCTVFVGNIKAAGLGSDLFAANRLDMLESDWTPAGNAQAVKRIHRIGQMRPCFVRFVTLANTFDEKVNDLVIQKTRAIADIEGEPMPSVPLDKLV